MRQFWLCAISIWVAAVATAQTTSEPLMQAQVPDWVIEQAMPEENAARSASIQDGISYLLLDEQTRWNEGVDFYYRVAYKVTDRTGLEEAARITPSYDPETTTLVFDRLKVTRDGQEVDRLNSTKVELLKREDSMMDGIIDGQLTAMVQLSDIRVGDTIDYAYHGHRDTPLWPDEFFFSTYLDWSIPLARQTSRVIVPAGADIVVTNVESDIGVTKTSTDGWDEYSLVSDDPEPVPGESNLPPETVFYGYVAFSSMDSWAEVVDWGLGLYDVKGDLPHSFAKRVDKIAKDYSSPDDRLVAALFLVQSEVRYLGIESGLGSHKPRTPAETIKLGYGDCKDKSLLLAVVLNRLGIDAHPALASLSQGFALDKGAVAIGAFDHAIVEARLDGETYWLDPTQSHQAGALENLSELDYGYVLPIRSDVSSLILIERTMPTAPEVDTVETYTFPEEGKDGLLLDVKTTYHGPKADQMRRRLANSGEAKLSREYLDFYADSYPELEPVKALSVSDDDRANAIVVSEAYRLSRDAFETHEMDTSLSVKASSLIGELATSIENGRVNDLALPYGINRTHTIRINTPGRQFTAPEDKAWDDFGIAYSRRMHAESESLDIEFSLAVSARSVPVARARQAVKRAEEIDANNKLTINLSRAGKTLARRLDLDAPLPPETETEINAITTLILAKKNLEALEQINTLSAKRDRDDAVQGYLSLLKGGILVDLDRLQASQAAFDDAFRLMEPDSPQTYLIYAGMLERDEKYVEAAKIVTRMFNKLPESIALIRVEWVGQLAHQLQEDKHFEESDEVYVAAAVALYANKDKADSTNRWLYSAAITPLIQKGDVEKAREILTEISDPETAMSLAMNRINEPLWNDIESLFGPHLEEGIKSFVAMSGKEAREDPSDFQKQSRYLNALRQQGSLEEGVDYGADIIQNWAKIEAIGDDAFWFVNEYAMMLSDAGRTDESAATYDKLLSMGIEQNPNLINMAINKAHMLLGAGRYDAVLAEVEELESLDDEMASDYGKMLIYGAKICALSQLGQLEAARDVWTAAIADVGDANPTSQNQAMICLGMDEEAADLMISRLENPAQKDSAIYAFVEASTPDQRSGFTSLMMRRASAIRQRPDVLAAFNKVGREFKVSGSEVYWHGL
jgi:transglutaminase-like putative cysteine protease/tetratricopeptide (TPR) repeat protein